MKKLRYKLPDAPVTNEEDFRARNTHGNRLSAEERIIRDGKYRLISLNLASTGLAFVELGKGNVLQIQRSITGPVLAGRKVKTKEKYTIPVTPKVEQWIVEMGSLPWKPFVTNNIITDDSTKCNSYVIFYKNLNEWLGLHIGYDEDATISPHRFRHSFAMRMLSHFKFSLHIVVRMMGDTEKMVRLYYDDYDDGTITTANNQKMIRYLKNKNNDDESKK